jgi:hypothetical protein
VLETVLYKFLARDEEFWKFNLDFAVLHWSGLFFTLHYFFDCSSTTAITLMVKVMIWSWSLIVLILRRNYKWLCCTYYHFLLLRLSFCKRNSRFYVLSCSLANSTDWVMISTWMRLAWVLWVESILWILSWMCSWTWWIWMTLCLLIIVRLTFGLKKFKFESFYFLSHFLVLLYKNLNSFSIILFLFWVLRLICS